jgi:glycosidase
MQWTPGPQAGFTSGRPWLRLNPDYVTRNVAAQNDDPNSVLNYYRQMIYLRRASPALRQGDYLPLCHRPLNVLAYLRRTPEQTVLVALNFFGWEANVKLDEPLPSIRWRVLLTSVIGHHERVRVAPYSLHLAPYEACVLEAV